MRCAAGGRAAAEWRAARATHRTAPPPSLSLLAHNLPHFQVFPWNYRSFLYRDLAWKAGLQYYPMSSLYPDFDKTDPALLAKRGDGVYGVYNSAEYRTKCSDPHMSSMDVYSIAECTHRAKYTFPMVNIEQLKVTINDALDDIGCRDSFCHEVEVGESRAAANPRTHTHTAHARACMMRTPRAPRPARPTPNRNPNPPPAVPAQRPARDSPHHQHAHQKHDTVYPMRKGRASEAAGTVARRE